MSNYTEMYNVDLVESVENVIKIKQKRYHFCFNDAALALESQQYAEEN